MPTYPQGAVDITTAELATQAVDALKDSREIAVDLEADALHAFRPRLCFIQVATDHQVFLFDTLVSDVRPQLLEPLMADAARTQFFHAAGGDLQYLAEEGVRVKGLFDTHRAATLLGWPKVGLADLAHALLGVEMPKEHQQSDFSIRPLPAAMHDYIADDVRYLCEIGRRVLEECRKMDILEEVKLDCQRLTDEAASRPEIGADFRPKLSPKLSPSERPLATAIAHSLHQLRLRWAEEGNIPFGRVLSNAAIAELASRRPNTLKELAKTPYVRGAAAREHGTEILSLIQSLRDQSHRGELEPEPAKKSKRDPQQRKREEALRAFRTDQGKRRKVVPSVVLSNSLIADLSGKPPRTLEELGRVPYFGQKRLQLYGRALIELLAQFR